MRDPRMILLIVLGTLSLIGLIRFFLWSFKNPFNDDDYKPPGFS